MCPQLGTQPAIQACALRIEPANFQVEAGTQYTEPHQPGLKKTFKLYHAHRKAYNILAGVAQWIERLTTNQMAMGLIPSQGTCLGWPGPQ